MIEDMIKDRRDVILKGWPTFVNWGPTFLIAEIVERDKTELPSYFCPWAPGIVIAGDRLLRAAGYRPGTRGPGGWSEGQPDVFTKVIYGNRLMVRGCGKLWTIERENEETLAFNFGPVPMFTRTRQAAMRLAEYCHPEPYEGEYPFPKPRGVASGLRWVFWDRGGIVYN
jgi:hypothetical protein